MEKQQNQETELDAQLVIQELQQQLIQSQYELAIAKATITQMNQTKDK